MVCVTNKLAFLKNRDFKKQLKYFLKTQKKFKPEFNSHYVHNLVKVLCCIIHTHDCFILLPKGPKDFLKP